MSLFQSDSLTIIKAIRTVPVVDRIALILSIWFGAGLLPGMPGTFGTIAAIPLYLLIVGLDTVYKVLLILTIILGAIWSSWRTQYIVERSDAQEIVIDEVAGFLLTVTFFPFTWLSLLGGFFLFRFFDILKPPPIKMVEKISKGGLGIVLDDLLAGVYASICLLLLFYMISL
jgi:phosphatidylglycerophosphatase A